MILDKPLFATVLAIVFGSGCTQPERSERGPAALPSGCVAIDGGEVDPVSGLPARILHEASGIVLVLVPAGELQMGSEPSEIGRSKAERAHRRAIRRPFYLGRTEVTHAQFQRFVAETGYATDAERGVTDDREGPGAFAAVPAGDREWNRAASWRHPFPNLADIVARDDHPVVQVSWNDAQAFCAHFGLRLPSEAQWEHACRAGTRTRYFWGETAREGASYANVADDSGRRRFPAFNQPFPFDDGVAVLAPVASYRPNAWGLYDVIGNVEEWCEDAFAAYPQDGADESPAVRRDSEARVLRGSCWLGNPDLCRSAARAALNTSSRRDFIGFRVALWTRGPGET